jgi:integrase
MASINKRPDGRWRARYRGPDGREITRHFDRKSDGEQWLTSVEHTKLAGTYVDPALGRTTLAMWATSWLEAVAPTLKPSTATSYEGLLRVRVLPTLGATPLASLRPSDVQALVISMEREGLSSSRIRQAAVVLGLVLDAAMRDGLVARNVARGVKLPRVRRDEAAYFDPATVERIADAMPSDEYRLLVHVLGRLGLRWGEAAGLRRRHVDLLRRRLVVAESLTTVNGVLHRGTPKSGATRSVPLSASLAAELGAHLDRHVAPTTDAAVFTSPEGAPLRHRSFYGRVWVPTLARLGLPAAGLHVLRHSAAAAMIQAGAGPKTVQTVLGHASAAFTLNAYGHLFDTDLDDLAERLDANLPRTGRGLDATPMPPERNDDLRFRRSSVAPGARLELATNGLTVRRSAN